MTLHRKTKVRDIMIFLFRIENVIIIIAFDNFFMIQNKKATINYKPNHNQNNTTHNYSYFY